LNLKQDLSCILPHISTIEFTMELSLYACASPDAFKSNGMMCLMATKRRLANQILSFRQTDIQFV
jgi:hypothetical protein